MAIITTTIHTAKNGKQVSISSATAADAAELLAVAQRIMAESKHLLTQGDEFKFTIELQEKRIKDFTDHPDGLLLLAKLDGQIVGMLDFKVGARRRIAHHGVLALALVPESVGLGLGRLMMNELIQWAKQNSRVEALRLEVHAKNIPAIALYEKLGFIVEGRQVRGVKFDNETYDDVIGMVLFV